MDNSNDSSDLRQSIISLLLDLRRDASESEAAIQLGWSLFLDRVVHKFESIGETNVASASRDARTLLARLTVCKDVIARSEEPESSTTQRAIAKLVRSMRQANSRSLPHEVHKSVALPTAQTFGFGMSSDAHEQATSDDETDAKAPSAAIRLRSNSYYEQPHEEIGVSIERAVTLARTSLDRHDMRTTDTLTNDMDTAIDDFEILLNERFRKAFVATSRTRELRYIARLLSERLNYLADAVSSILEVGSRRKVHAADHLWKVYVSIVAATPPGNFPLVNSTWKELRSLAYALPRSSNYFTACVQENTYIREADLAAVYSRTLFYGINLALAVVSAVNEQSTRMSGPADPQYGDITDCSLHAIRQASDAVDIAALRDYMQRNMTTPSELRKFIDLEKHIRNQQALLNEPFGQHAPGMNADVAIPSPSSSPTSLRRRMFDAPYSLLTQHFRGRDDELAILAYALVDSTDQKTSLQLVTGVEGVGKTQLVLTYISFLWEVFPHRHVFWLCAASPDQLRRGLEALLTMLHDEASSIQDPESRARRVQAQLQTRSDAGHNWTLIVDDVRPHPVTSRLLAMALPLTARGAHIVFTSRFAQPSVLDFLLEYPLPRLGLSTVSPEAALQILLAAAGLEGPLLSPTERQHAEQVVSFLRYFPLAVKHAGSYLNQSPISEQPIQKLYTLLTADSTRKTSDQVSPSNQYSRLGAVSLLASLRDAQITRPEAYQLLEILAFMDPENIPLGTLLEPLLNPARELSSHSLVQQPMTSRGHAPLPLKRSGSLARDTRLTPQSDAGESLMTMLSTPKGRQKVVLDLLNTKLVGLRSSDVVPRLRLHDQMQQLVVQCMDNATRRERFAQAVSMLHSTLHPIIDNLDKQKVWRQCDLLAPHLLALVAWGRQYGIRNERLFALYASFGWYFYVRGRYVEAETCYSTSIPELSGDARLHAQQSLARVYLRQGNFHKAQLELESILHMTDGQPVLERKYLDVADLLARSYYSQGWVAKAERLYEAILLDREKDKDDLDHEKANTLEGLANILQLRGDDRAGQLYQRVLVSRKRELGSKYLSLQRARYNQARLLRDQGELKEATRVFKSVLSEYKDVLGDDHPDTHRVASRLAFTYLQSGKLDKAEQLAHQTLTALQIDVAQHYAAIGLSRRILAMVAAQRGNFEDSKDLLSQVLLVYNERLGRTHPTTLHVLWEFSDVCQHVDGVDEAIRMLEAVEEKDRDGTLVNAKLARLYDHRAGSVAKRNATERERAQKLAQQTYEKQRKRQGSKSADTNYTEWVLARIYVHMGDLLLASDFYEKALLGWHRIPHAILGGSIDDLLAEYVDVLEQRGEHLKADEKRQMIGQGSSKVLYAVDSEPPMSSADENCWADEDPNMTFKSTFLDDKETRQLTSPTDLNSPTDPWASYTPSAGELLPINWQGSTIEPFPTLNIP